jgi:acetylglutamate kinase
VNILVKIGGTLLDNAASRESLCIQIMEVAKKPQSNVVVVHGGGKQMTRFLEERGVKSEFVDGLRVSTPEVIDAVLKVLAGTVNHSLVSGFVKAGIPAIGLSGIDMGMVECEVLDPRLGFVGKPVRANANLLGELCRLEYLPVVACVGGDRRGNVYNVNADQMASVLAGAWGANQLLFLTDVDGVRGSDGKTVAVLKESEAKQLMENGVATGGMLAKLRYAIEALEGGLDEVRIVNGAADDIVRRALSGEEVGTAIVPER